MSILDSYNNIPPRYSPNNMVNRERRRKQVKLLPPYQKGHKSFWWRQGDQFVFTYTPSFEIRVEKDAIILYGQDIDESIVGIKGQRAYDIINLISYTCTAGYDGKLNWTRDNIFTVPKIGEQIITLQNIDWTIFSVNFSIWNWKKDTIYTTELNGSYPLTIVIDDELVELLKYGSYNFVFTLTAVIDDMKTVLVKDILEVNIVNERPAIASQTIQSDDEWVDVHIFYDGGEEIIGDEE